MSGNPPRTGMRSRDVIAGYATRPDRTSPQESQAAAGAGHRILSPARYRFFRTRRRGAFSCTIAPSVDNCPAAALAALHSITRYNRTSLHPWTVRSACLSPSTPCRVTRTASRRACFTKPLGTLSGPTGETGPVCTDRMRGAGIARLSHRRPRGETIRRGCAPARARRRRAGLRLPRVASSRSNTAESEGRMAKSSAIDALDWIPGCKCTVLAGTGNDRHVSTCSSHR